MYEPALCLSDGAPFLIRIKIETEAVLVRLVWLAAECLMLTELAEAHAMQLEADRIGVMEAVHVAIASKARADFSLLKLDKNQQNNAPSTRDYSVSEHSVNKAGNVPRLPADFVERHSPIGTRAQTSRTN